MKLARVIRLDDSDPEVFRNAAQAGEWAIPGTFAFSNWGEDDLTGKPRQEFAHGWLGLESFGRGTIVAVAPVTQGEIDALATILAHHFIDVYSAPHIGAARPVAEEEIAHMQTMCSEQPDNTLIVIDRELTDTGIREKFRLIPPESASLETFAVHGS